MFDLFDELGRVIDVLEERGIEYALCGGLAMAVWSHPRATVDIDLLIQPAALPAVEEISHQLGFVIKARPMRFAGGAVEIQRFSKIDPVAGDVLMLDLLLVTPLLTDVWSTRLRVDWDRGSLTVVSREGLVKLKSLRGSGIDLDDIRRLQEEG